MGVSGPRNRRATTTIDTESGRDKLVPSRLCEVPHIQRNAASISIAITMENGACGDVHRNIESTFAKLPRSAPQETVHVHASRSHLFGD